jgi:hypothetical protein
MKWLALVMLLAVFQASPPVPRKAPDRPAQSNSAKQPENTEHTVGISKLPTVTVANPKRDWADWAYWGFNALLVAVGALQVVLLLWTLRAIRRQADEMARQVDLTFGQLRAMHEQITEMSEQTDVLETSVAAAQKGADAALLNAQAVINAERAWVIPELRPLVHLNENARRWLRRNGSWLTEEDILRGEHLQHCLKLRNMGKTPAQIISFQISYTCLPELVVDLPPDTKGQLIRTEFFNHFLAGGEAIEITEPPIDVNSFILESYERISELESTAVFHGWVQYRHMFSSIEDWFADFCYVYTPRLKCLTSAGPYPKQRLKEQ